MTLSYYRNRKVYFVNAKLVTLFTGKYLPGIQNLNDKKYLNKIISSLIRKYTSLSS